MTRRNSGSLNTRRALRSHTHTASGYSRKSILNQAYIQCNTPQTHIACEGKHRHTHFQHWVVQRALGWFRTDSGHFGFISQTKVGQIPLELNSLYFSFFLILLLPLPTQSLFLSFILLFLLLTSHLFLLSLPSSVWSFPFFFQSLLFMCWKT